MITRATILDITTLPAVIIVECRNRKKEIDMRISWSNRGNKLNNILNYYCIWIYGRKSQKYHRSASWLYKFKLVLMLTNRFSILALISRASVKKASSTLIEALADVSINLIPYSIASSSPRSFETCNKKSLQDWDLEFIIPRSWYPPPSSENYMCFI